MGGLFSKYFPVLSRKRRRFSSDDDYIAEDIEEKLLWPRKRAKYNPIATPRVIYEEFFKVGSYSDIKIIACGHEWNLHRPILKQCPYFDAMLTEPWKEAQQNVINIELVDSNITRQAIDFVFGTLYCSDVPINKENLIGVVAAASLFQMVGLVNRCGEVMIDVMTNYNIMKYYAVADQYGVPNVKEHVFMNLLYNIVGNKNFRPVLHQISVELMARLVDNSQLLVCRSELNVYRTLLRWLYSHLHQAPNECSNQEIVQYFKNLPGTENFLSTKEGEEFLPAFRKLRLKHLLINTQLIHNLTKDRVLPAQWITEGMCENYSQSLWVHEGHDRGPSENEKEELSKRGMRFGRRIRRAESPWRWQIALVGLDLSWSIENNCVVVWRTRQTDLPWLTNTLIERHILVRVKLAPVSQRKTPFVSSDIMYITLPLNQKVHVAKVPENLKFPAFLCLELLPTSNQTSPSNEAPV